VIKAENASHLICRKIYNTTIWTILPYMCAESVLVGRSPFCQCLENKLWNYNLTYSYRLLLELPNKPGQVHYDVASKYHTH